MLGLWVGVRVVEVAGGGQHVTARLDEGSSSSSSAPDTSTVGSSVMRCQNAAACRVISFDLAGHGSQGSARIIDAAPLPRLVQVPPRATYPKSSPSSPAPASPSLARTGSSGPQVNCSSMSLVMVGSVAPSASASGAYMRACCTSRHAPHSIRPQLLVNCAVC